MRKTNSGITLIALVITIIVLMILAGVSIAMLTGENGILTQAQEAINKTEAAEIEEQVNLWKTELMIGEGARTESKFLEDLINSTKIKDEDIDPVNKTVNFNGILVSYYTEEYGAWSEDENINMPQVKEGMIPVKWNGTNWEICSKDDDEWYDYEQKKWANIMLSDGTYDIMTEVGTEVGIDDLGSMFVWIPRYSYSINEYMTSYTASGEGTTQEIFDIEFLVGTSNKDADGNTYPYDYNYDSVNVGESTPMIVHSGFEFDNKQIPGFWSAKFEVSMNETNLNTTENNDSLTPTIKVVPNAETWRYISLGNSFGNCIEMNDENNIYGITENTESMLMQNKQWGAIAYLTTSKYGFTPVINGYYVAENGIHRSWSAEGNYIANVNQSTTGNVTGIYDLNGGNNELIASYWANGDAIILENGKSEYFDASTKKIKLEYAKYWEEYTASSLEKESVKNDLWNKDYTYNSTRMEIADDRYNMMKTYKGDAMYEVIEDGEYSYYGKTTSGTRGWVKELEPSGTQIEFGAGYYNNDYMLIGNCARPFVTRGGDWWGKSGSLAGIFALSSTSAGAYYADGFRSVLL